MNLPCRCNRNYLHCTKCGSRNVYPLLAETQIRSAKYDELVNAYRCKRCMEVFDDKTLCTTEKVFSSKETGKTVSTETPEQKVKRLLDEKKTPEQIAEIMNEDEVSVSFTQGRVVNQPVFVDGSEKPETAEVTLDDVIKRITEESKK